MFLFLYQSMLLCRFIFSPKNITTFLFFNCVVFLFFELIKMCSYVYYHFFVLVSCISDSFSPIRWEQEWCTTGGGRGGGGASKQLHLLFVCVWVVYTFHLSFCFMSLHCLLSVLCTCHCWTISCDFGSQWHVTVVFLHYEMSNVYLFCQCYEITYKILEFTTSCMV
jgi:hypothetical protein